MPLAAGIISRSFTRVSQVTGLIQQQGADPDAQPQLRVEGTTGRFLPFPLLSLCIDNLTEYRIPSILAVDANDDSHVALPQWSSPDLQEGVMKALIDGGADINAIPTDEEVEDWPGFTPIRIAIKACNETAFRLLMAEDGLQLGGRGVMGLPWTLETDRPTEDHEATLLSFYKQLIDRNPTLATETDGEYGDNPVHWVASNRPVWSQSFIDSYLDLLVDSGADITAVDYRNATPFHYAAMWGSHRVAASLCRRLTAADINRGRPNYPHHTPLWSAARELDVGTQLLDDDTAEESSKDYARASIPRLKTTICVLLQAGADIARLPNATVQDRRRRQLVLVEYTTVLNEVPHVVMSAINAALRPQREWAALLTCALPQMTKIELDTLFPRHPCLSPSPQPTNTIEQGTSESPADGDSDNRPLAVEDMSAVAWRVASFFVDPSALEQTPRPVHNATLFGRRINKAMDAFVRSAASLQAAGNQQVVGSGEDSQGPLQCFVLGGAGGRRLGVREVVHKARLDEAAQHGVEGVVKGFNEHLDSSDCQFQWQQLGYIDRRGQFVSLGIN
ncbi:unnamed protein product [Vitrella brassicaformis CCMP3155]|uniref:Uncharacterized protein n=1 Tax=Vitrella brassicaformis (strain CCMP3155) TaxID=1169540 RepID=A0A0G4EXT3_VITBC|nr:unnamed protein product [Vitrella brassicaformis CCMP3155]|eukprot:CEM03210.1 unnamed protein product [Vitrella brassicaformis CCMP3155]